MKRKIVLLFLCLSAAFLETSFLDYLEIASIRPNLQVILTTSFALMCGVKSGMGVGFTAGLFLDIVSGGILGYNALILTWIGYLAGIAYRIFYDDDIKTPLILIAATDLLFCFYQYMTTFMFRGRIHFFFYLKRIIIPEMLYTAMLAVVIYQLNFWINKKLPLEGRRRAPGERI